ncbi:MAG TPA: hypothetical protein PKL31_16465 [Fulvivirga sp.]|nr:hypothetical protein [Fulvivirga sp.]
MKTSILLIALFLPLSMVIGQGNLNDLEYGAYLTNSKSLWKSAVQKRTAIYTKSKNMSDLFDLVLAQHGLLGATMGDKDETLFDEYLDSTKDNLDLLIEQNYQLAESKALLSSIYGFEMGYSSWKGIYLGSKSSGLIDDALAVDNNSPLVWQIYASSKLFTPTMFGGDKNEAVKAYEKAIALYDQQGSSKLNNWRYLDAQAWLGQAYIVTGKKEKGVAVFENVLQQEPDFNWVSKVLLPKAQPK